jgi:hypothetical protein
VWHVQTEDEQWTFLEAEESLDKKDTDASPESQDTIKTVNDATWLLYHGERMKDAMADFCRKRLIRRQIPSNPGTKTVEFVPIVKDDTINWEEQKEAVWQDLDDLEQFISHWKQCVRAMGTEEDRFKAKILKKKLKKKKAAAAAAAAAAASRVPLASLGVDDSRIHDDRIFILIHEKTITLFFFTDSLAALGVD